MYQFQQKYEAAQLFSALIMIRNVISAPNQHILEWFLKDPVTEDWSNDAKNAALHHKNKWHFNTYLSCNTTFGL